MSKSCIVCGNPFWGSKTPWKRFCGHQCQGKMLDQKPIAPTNNEIHFKIFQNMVAAAESPIELKKFLELYCGGVIHA